MSENQKLVQQGIQYLESGKLLEAETCFTQFIQTNYNNPDPWHLLGIVSAQKKEYPQAIEQIMRAIQLNPKAALFYKNLANVYQDKGDIESAISAFSRALELAPKSWDIYYKLGILFGIKNDFASAIKFLETFVKAQPHHVDGYPNLGVAYGKQGETEKAIAAFEKALALNPNQVNTLNNLGNAYIEYGELEKAILSCQKAIELEPNYAEAHFHLALALQKQGQITEAVKSYQKALEIKPNYSNALNNLGNVFSSQGRFSDAIESYQKALKIEPKLRDTLFTLGNVLLSQGRTNEVLQSYQGAFNIDPEFIVARSNYVFSLNYSDSHQPETIYQEHQKWAELYETPLTELIPHHPNVPNPEKKIRLGYVSGDFKNHSVAFFIESILADRNRQKFEIICYSNTSQRDKVTGRLKALADGWRQIETMGDQKVAELIQQDEIDILVDLSGHSSDNRLLVFARKPAPVQVTYLGYPNTTGLKNIDYRITDCYTDPPGETDSLYSETLIRLPHGFLCYTPLSDAPDVSLPPCLTKKYITFGSFNNFAKITPTVIHYWSEIINSVPGSRILLKTNYTIDKQSQNYWYELIEKGGIERGRLELVSKLPDSKQHLDFYQHIDIALDTFPYNGTTTTCEALWMGVPVITLAGKTHVSRVGVSLLSVIGLEEFIAYSPEDYVQKAVTLARDLPKLQELRQTLPYKIQASPLTDGQLIAQSLENAYRQMWRNWCQQKLSDNTVQTTQALLSKPQEESESQTGQDIRIESQKLVQQGIQCLESGKLQEANIYLGQALQIDDNNVDAWHILGIVSAQKKEYSQGIEQILRAIQFKPNEPVFYKNLANLYQDKGDIDQAIAYYTRVIELAPQWWEIYYILGLLSGQKNDFISAIKFLEQFVKAQPEHIYGYHNLGVAYAKLGEIEKAIATFHQVLTLNPNHPHALNSLGQVYQEKAILNGYGKLSLNYNNFYSAQNKTLYCGWNHGFFSNCCVTFWSLIDLLNQNTVPEAINFSNGFNNFRNQEQLKNKSNLYPYYFYTDSTHKIVIDKRIIKPDHHGIYKNYDFSIYNWLMGKYFNLSRDILSIKENLIIKYQIDFSKTIAVCYRGTDKHLEVKLADPNSYIKVAENILHCHPGFKILVQTDQKQTRDLFAHHFQDQCFFFPEMPVTEGNKVLHQSLDHLDCDGFEFGKKVLAITHLLSQCKFIVNHTGNMAFWICLFRGNTEGVFQFNQEGKLVTPEK